MYYQSSSPAVDAHHSYFGLALNLIYGRQFIFGNSITVGYYVGIGYGIESKTSSYSINSVNVPTPIYSDIADFGRYSHTYLGDKFPITWTGGFTIGYIFKTPEWISSIGKGGNRSKAPSRHSMD